jgi:transmembrane protein 18
MEEVYKVVEEVKAAMNEHIDLVSDLIQRVSSELRSGYAPAVDNFLGFFHAIDWKVRFLLFSLIFACSPVLMKVSLFTLS